MNWVQKYYEDTLSDVEEFIVTDMPFFFNGLEIREDDSTIRLLLYQEPFSPVVVSLIMDCDIVLDKTRVFFSQTYDGWVWLVG